MQPDLPPDTVGQILERHQQQLAHTRALYSGCTPPRARRRRRHTATALVVAIVVVAVAAAAGVVLALHSLQGVKL